MFPKNLLHCNNNIVSPLCVFNQWPCYSKKEKYAFIEIRTISNSCFPNSRLQLDSSRLFSVWVSHVHFSSIILHNFHCLSSLTSSGACSLSDNVMSITHKGTKVFPSFSDNSSSHKHKLPSILMLFSFLILVSEKAKFLCIRGNTFICVLNPIISYFHNRICKICPLLALISSESSAALFYNYLIGFHPSHWFSLSNNFFLSPEDTCPCL
jgi:hypothetical protein